MKKRLISLLVALCMAVTLLPVSALTAWAEGGDQLRIVDGYPVGSGDNHDRDCSGEGWSYNGSTQTLDLHPDSPTEYDFFSIISGYGPITKCKLTIGRDAIIVEGIFDNTVINNGKISGGQFSSSSSLTNHGTITGGLFSSVSNESDGKIENGTFRSTVTNNGTIKGGIFDKKPAGDTVASGYTLNVNFPENGSYECYDAGINYFGNSGYVIPNSDHNTSITIHIFFRNRQAILFPIDVTFGNTNDTHCLLEDWAPSPRYYDDGHGYFSVTFTAPPANAATVTLSMLTRLVIDENGYPVGTKGGTRDYSGNGWKFDASNNTLTLESGNYNFLYTDPVNKKGENLRSVNCGIVNEGGIIEDGIFNALVANGQPGSTSSEPHVIEGGTFAAGLLYNDGVITGGAFNGKDSVLNKLSGSTVVSDTALSGDYRSVTVNGGAIVKVNDTLPLVYNETTHDLVQSSAWDLYSYAGTILTVESNVDITNINGQEIGKAFNSYYPNGKTNKKVVCFEMPDSDVELNSTKIVVPDPKPEPKPEPEPEAPTYTLTVKGGTFTYNGSEAMTSANVPVDAEVKVTLNQSAVPEGMVFDLWAMDEASLLGNPAVAYNEESFTIPADSVAKGSTVTVEAQYRDATIESEPSILGTAAIIGVAGAGTAVIVWQGYRIGMELYEKYFQPTPEETAVVEPTLEGQMTDPIS